MASPIFENDPARFIRRMADNTRYTTSVANLKNFRTPNQVRDLFKKQLPRVQTKKAMARYEKQILKFENKWPTVPIPYQAVRFGATAMKIIMIEEGNKSLFPNLAIKKRKDIDYLIEEEKASQGVSLTKAGSVTLTIRNHRGVGFEMIKGTHEYRDPEQQGSGDPIHQGAKAKFKRYAITQLDLLGRRRSAGRKGTEFQGLGLEPPLDKLPNRASVGNKKDYIAFKRVGYPSRSSPDTITNEFQYGLYYEMWQDRRIRTKIIKDSINIVLGVYTDYKAGMVEAVINDVRKIS